MVLAAHFERKINYCTDLEKSVLVNNFEKRHWTAVNAEDDWNFFWAGMNTCRSIFSVDNGYRMNDNQYGICSSLLASSKCKTFGITLSSE